MQRLVIPGALAAVVAGGAIGAAASYLASHSTSAGPMPGSTFSGGSSSTQARRAASTGAHRRPGPTTTTPATSPSAAPGGVAAGHDLNDRGYALIQRREFLAAIPLLRRAVVDLRGAGPADPYEAYANYNLGYALLATDDCAGALPPLAVARRLETSPLVLVAIRNAQACRPQGS